MTDSFKDRLTTPATGQDPSNTDIEQLVAPLAPDDNVFTLVNPDQGDIRELHPVGEDEEDQPK